MANYSRYMGLRRGARLSRRSSASSSRCTTQQLAHQVVEGLAGGSPVRIAQRPGEKRVGLFAPLRASVQFYLEPINQTGGDANTFNRRVIGTTADADTAR